MLKKVTLGGLLSSLNFILDYICDWSIRKYMWKMSARLQKIKQVESTWPKTHIYCIFLCFLYMLGGPANLLCQKNNDLTKSKSYWKTQTLFIHELKETSQEKRPHILQSQKEWTFDRFPKFCSLTLLHVCSAQLNSHVCSLVSLSLQIVAFKI